MGVTTSAGVAIFNTSHTHKLLESWGSNQTGTTWSRNQTYTYRTTLTGNLVRYGVRLADHLTPVTTTYRNDRDLGQDDSSTDSVSNFRSGLYTQTNVTVVVTYSNEGLETGTLTSARLLLYRHDLHDFILKLAFQEVVKNFAFLDRKGEKVDFFQRVDLTVLDEATKLGYRYPFLGFGAAATTATTATTAETTTTTSVSWSIGSWSLLRSFRRHLEFL